MDKLKAFKKPASALKQKQDKVSTSSSSSIGGATATKDKEKGRVSTTSITNASNGESIKRKVGKKRKVDASTASSDSLPHKKAKGAESGSNSSAANAFDLDGLFSSMKEKKKEAEEAAQKDEQKRLKKEAKAAKEAEALRKIESAGLKSNRMKGSDSPTPVRFDSESGLPVYSEEQLGVFGGAKRGAGFTADCPIDCKCCF